MISKEDVKKIGELARIELSEKEENDLARDLQSVLGYFDKLKEISSDYLPSRVSGEHFESNSRKDELPDKAYSDVAELVSSAPEADEGYIKVNPVFSRV